MFRRTLIAAALVAAASPSFAFLDSLTGGASGASQQLKDTQSLLITEYVKASQMVVASQQNLAKALNLKNRIDDLNDIAKTLKSGNLTSDTVKKVSATSAAVNKEITESLKKTKKLSASQTKELGVGLAKYATGAALTAAMGATTKKFGEMAAKETKSANALGKAAILKEVAVAASISENLPDHAKNLVNGGNQLVKIAKSRSIDTKAAQKNLSKAASFNF